MALHGHTQVAICNILGYSISRQSLGRWLALYKETLMVVCDPDNYKERGYPKLLLAEDSIFMVKLVCNQPGLFLNEVSEKNVRPAEDFAQSASNSQQSCC
ncbi:hypothetical protein VP01_6854g2 [Puccinia sorghi]|uniref:Uncharacterized protein n=1 Tax=Puccinia sorghi TaxID=27349 RepID=A0A0L6UEC9_9BASI|nr:hypothetical protein VP01_6854g2 [Puccinia sorghi]